MANDIQLQPIHIGTTPQFKPTIKKDGIPWDLTTGTVTITLEKPDRETTITDTMSPVSASDGIFSYTPTADIIDTPGWWTIRLTMTDGAVVEKYPHEISFLAKSQP